MAFGKKKKEPVVRKLTQTHKISVEGTLNVNGDDQILIDLEDIGVVTLASVLREMDGQSVTLQVSNQRSDNLDVELEFENKGE